MTGYFCRAFLACAFLTVSLGACTQIRGTGDLGIVIERAAGSILVVETTHHRQLSQVQGLGDLSHASAVYSRDQRYAYVFGRDGGLTKVDLLEGRIRLRELAVDGLRVRLETAPEGGVDLAFLSGISERAPESEPGKSPRTSSEAWPFRLDALVLRDARIEVWIPPSARSRPRWRSPRSRSRT